MNLFQRSALLGAVAVLSACSDAVAPEPRMAPADPAPSQQRTGWIWRDGAAMPIEVTYEERDGVAVWQGDIIIGRAGEVPATREQVENPARRGPRTGLLVSAGPGRWPGAVIPYQLDPALVNPQRVADAIAYIEAQWSYMDFVPRTGQADYVLVTNAAGANDCAAWVGRKGGQQEVFLGSNCERGRTIHELLHAAGMHHEHNRCDRDSYLTVKWANLIPSATPYYQPLCDGYDDFGAYDLGSIMHYNPYADTRNGSRTLEPRPLNGTNLSRMGQRDSMTARDRASLVALYPRPQGPAGLAAAYPGGVPTLSWQAAPNAAYYSVQLTERYEESDYERGNTTWESSYEVGTTTGLGMQDLVNTWTGTYACNVYSSSWGSADRFFYYDVYTVFPNGTFSWNARIEADVARC